jgi:hypothetical protein
MSEDDIHVMPVDDLREHVFENCPCNPEIGVVDADLIYIHNSWDGKEFVEQVEEFLGIENESELNEDSTCKDYLQVQMEGDEFADYINWGNPEGDE